MGDGASSVNELSQTIGRLRTLTVLGVKPSTSNDADLGFQSL